MLVVFEGVPRLDQRDFSSTEVCPTRARAGGWFHRNRWSQAGKPHVCGGKTDFSSTKVMCPWGRHSVGRKSAQREAGVLVPVGQTAEFPHFPPSRPGCPRTRGADTLVRNRTNPDAPKTLKGTRGSPAPPQRLTRPHSASLFYYIDCFRYLFRTNCSANVKPVKPSPLCWEKLPA